jgi:hypothetical protein
LRQRDERKARNSSGSPISLRTRLAVTLRWLAGASHWDLCFAWGLSSSSFYSPRGVLWPTIKAINKAFKMGFPANDEDRLEQLAAGFRQHSGGLLDGCVLALDGVGVPIHCPYKKDVERQKDYRFCKGGFAIIVLAGTDVDGRFICATARHSGRTNDIKAWEDSDLCHYLEIEKGLPEKYFFTGDDAFTNTNQFLSPWPGRGLDRYRDAFNYWLSHSWQCVEHGFGMLTQ